MLAPFHLGKRDSGSKNIISINKLTNLFIKVIKNFLLLSPAGLCFPSLPTCLSHYPPVLPLSHHPPVLPSPAGCGLTGASSIRIARSSRAMSLKESNRETKTKESNRAAAKKEETAPLKRKHPFAQTFRSSRNVTEKINIEA